MATILKAPARLTAAQRKTTTTLYLAGPFEDGDGDATPPRSWRDEVIDAFADDDVTLVDPRNPRWPGLEARGPGQRGAFEWQCTVAYDADVVIVWVPEGRHAPTALMILGALAAKRSKAGQGSSVVVGGDGWGGLLKVFAQNQRLFPIDGGLDEVIRIARLQLNNARAARR